MKTTFMSFSFGCRVNEAEKLALNQKLTDLGFIYDEVNPQIYIINSCSVTQKAEREVRQYIYQIRKKFPQTKIVVTGCAATNWLQHKSLIRDVDLLISNEEKHLTVEKLITKLVSLRGVRRTTWQSSISNKEIAASSSDWIRNDNFKDKFLDSGRLVIKIQDGCRRFCSYCIVPYLRGKPKSKTISQILQEIRQYPDIKEVILSAINTEYFGLENKQTLIGLIDAIINNTAVPRISFGSIHPWSLTGDFINYYQKIIKLNRLVNYFHIPLQSGSDKILKLMNRKYSIQEFIDKLENIKQINPRAFIGTDIIVGFPGETEAEFNKTYKFLKTAPVDKFHVFRFSLRKETAAEKLIKFHQLPDVKQVKQWSQKLIKLSEIKYQKFTKSLIGKSYPALFLKPKTKGLQTALLSNNVLINLKAPQNLCGQIKRVKIRKIEDVQLVGELI